MHGTTSQRINALHGIIYKYVKRKLNLTINAFAGQATINVPQVAAFLIQLALPIVLFRWGGEALSPFIM